MRECSGTGWSNSVSAFMILPKMRCKKDHSVAVGRGKNGLILWSWRDDQEGVEEECGLRADCQMTWPCWLCWWQWLPTCSPRLLVKFTVCSLLFKALHLRLQLPFLVSPFFELLVPPSYSHLLAIVRRHFLSLCPLYGMPGPSDAAVSFCCISSTRLKAPACSPCTEHSTLQAQFTA